MLNEPGGTARIRRHSEEIFRLLVSGVKDYAIFMLDPTGNVITWNDGAERINGYRSNEILGKHFSKFYTPEAIAAKHPQEELRLAIKNGQYEEEGWRVRKDGSRFWANVVITPIIDQHELIGFAKITRDLTARRKVNELEQVFRLLVNGVKDYAIFMLDPDGNVLTWNEGAEAIKGYKAEEIIGEHFSIFYPEDKKREGHTEYELQMALKNGRYEEEGWRIRKDGSLFWANVLITAIYDNDQLIGFAKVTRDLSEKKKLEEQRENDTRLLAETITQLQNLLQAKSRFLSVISHEVRTPLSGIIGMAELLTLNDLGHDNNQIARTIFTSAKGMLQLLNDLLEASRMDEGKVQLDFRQFSIRTILDDVCRLADADVAKKNLHLKVHCDDNVPKTLCGDDYRCKQILQNLIFNAIKFTSKGGIDIFCHVKDSSVGSTTLRIEVKDTGIGIAAEAMSQLFKPFTQAERSTSRYYGGSGLGLSICKGLVDIMHGQIGAESVEGNGSSFWIEIPFNDLDC